MGDIEIASLRKEFDMGQIVAVDDLDLAIEDGEFITVVGPSGCGKTTTLRMLAGLERPSAGRVFIDGEDVTHESAKQRDIAMVFQDYALYPHKTVRQNMEFGLRMSTDMSKDERRERVRSVAEMMGIEDLLDQKPGEISGGQQQRVALGRAIVREPAVFLFDEPLSNLDAKLRTTMRTEIQQLQNELEITSVYVTHDQEEAMTMGDRIVILNGGELQQVGKPTDVYANPANEFVGGFIGSPSMNFLDVSTRDSSDGLYFEGDEFSYQVSNGFRESLREATDATEFRLGVRPEAIDIRSGQNEEGIDAVVDVVEPLGSDNYLYLSLGERSTLGEDDSKQITARVDAELEPEEGAHVQLLLDEDDLHVFRADTGDNVFFEESPAAKQVSLPT